MRLISAQIQNFRSISQSGKVEIDPKVTVLVGQNESGKTAFLNALELCQPVHKSAGFIVDRDYPRKAVNEYRRRHEVNPDTVVELTYELDSNELDQMNAYLGMNLFDSLQFFTHHNYKNSCEIVIEIDESPYLCHLVSTSNLHNEIKEKCVNIKKISALIQFLANQDLNAEGKEFSESLTKRFAPEKNSWKDLLKNELLSKFINNWLPKFFYFDDYYLLPGKVNLKSLVARIGNPAMQTNEDQTALSLLRLAEVDPTDLISAKSYEEIKSRLEGLSNSITDTIFEYWKQNQELDVEFDIRLDPTDLVPYNDGPNLYIRIKNRKHRVTVPFSQRSKGFIWFFSFIVWFDTIKKQIPKVDALVLLLDEPGLSLHALAQSDYLRYIDKLSHDHQIIYTTHSPFMIHSDRLHQVRLVEDRSQTGTVVTANLSGSDPKTVFPLQAALGYTVAQNLFIAKRNLLVEGPADLIYLKMMSAMLEKCGKQGLRDDVTIVPTGGLDKVTTFISLLGANELEIVVLHDWASKPDPRIDTLVREKIINKKYVVNYGQFRSATKGTLASNSPPATDIEDMFSVDFYIEQFLATFAKELGGRPITESDLPPRDRIIERLNIYLSSVNIVLRPSGGFNHYAVANYLATNPSTTLDVDTADRFAEMFNVINGLFSRTSG